MLGPALTAVIIVVFVVWRLRNLFHIPHRLLAGLSYYQLPSDEDLIRLFKIPTSSRSRRQDAPNKQLGQLTVAKRELADVKLVQTPITVPGVSVEGFLANRHSWEAYQSTVLFAICGLLTVAVTRFLALFPFGQNATADWGLIWLLIAIAYDAQSIAVTSLRFATSRSEMRRSILVAVIAFIAILLSFSLVEIDFLDFDISGSYKALGTAYEQFVKEADLGELPFRLTYRNYQISLALSLSFLTGMVSLALFRRANWQFEILNRYGVDSVKGSTLQASYFMPLFVSISYLSFVRRTLPEPLVPLIRIAIALVSALVQLGVFRMHMQAYFDTVPARLKLVAKQPGNITLADFQAQVVPAFFHVCVAAVQSIGLPLIHLLLAVALASSGGAGYGIPYFTRENPIMGGILGPVLSLCVWWLESSNFALTTVGMIGALLDF